MIRKYTKIWITSELMLVHKWTVDCGWLCWWMRMDDERWEWLSRHWILFIIVIKLYDNKTIWWLTFLSWWLTYDLAEYCLINHLPIPPCELVEKYGDRSDRKIMSWFSARPWIYQTRGLLLYVYKHDMASIYDMNIYRLSYRITHGKSTLGWCITRM